ncbi:NADPH-dependent FMN reductase [Maribacter algicola]|uniref:NADPH-dependent FMN reductase n=1 Tax=Meishania litoralis TaxID=3434685 RepID=A0ACC7LJX9_9FLAO
MAAILAFAGSNSSTSINLKLVHHTIALVSGHEIRTLNMVDYPFPMFSEDYERENGYSNSLVELKNDIQNVDALILSVNEHNGNPSAYFKNLLDWLSRVDRKFLESTKVLLMSTSGGKRGGMSSLEVVKNMLPRFGAEVVATFSLPSFNENFDVAKGILDEDLAESHRKALDEFLNAL